MSTLSVDTIQGKTTAGTVAMPAGMVIQTLENSDYTRTTSTSTTFADTGLSQAITPKFSTSKILVIVKHLFETYGSINSRAKVKLVRDSTDVCHLESLVGYAYNSDVSNFASTYSSGNCVGFVLDSPNTTSQITYKTQFGLGYDGTVAVNGDDSSSYERSRGSIVLMEIKQ